MKFSLNMKAILLIVCIAAMISVLAVAIYDRGIHEIIELEYSEHSIEIANLVASRIDAERLRNVRQAVQAIYDQADNKVQSDQWGTPEFNAYVEQFSAIYDMEDYRALLHDLRAMQDAVKVDCLYLTWIDVKNECYIYLVDAAEEEPCPVGCIDPIYTTDPEVRNNPELGLPPNITNTPEYGWILATFLPVRDAEGNVVAMSAVDISMNEIMNRQYTFLIYVALAFLGLTLFICFIGIIVVHRTIVKPINRLTQAAAQYALHRNVFSSLNMARSDEIGVLAESMTHMEEEINGYISNLEKTTNDLISAREHAQQMDRAANIDALTKVRNKRAYDIEVERLNGSAEPFAIVMVDMNGLKDINDTYGHEKGDVSIKTVCRVICEVFKHSPVYRVGGDEFIVVLEHGDFDEKGALLQAIRNAFRQQVADASLPPWERVSAAVGCAAYNPKMDQQVNSVLKRADAAMYEEKRAFKAAR